MRKFIFISCFFCISLVVSCAAISPKVFDKKLAQLDRMGIVLATVTSENRLDESDKLQPGEFVMRKNGKEDEGFVLYGSKNFRLFTKNKELCLIVLEVVKGNYFISSIRGVVLGDVFLPVFKVQIRRPFEANEDEILYIGNIHLVLRKKASNSEDSASVPLAPTRVIDSIAIAGTTIDVEINDEYQRDIFEFEKAFPKLKGYTVIKKMLPLQPVPLFD